MSSTCGVFTHVTSEPAPSLRLRAGPAPRPRPTSVRLRSAELTLPAARTERSGGGALSGQAELWASAWLRGVPRGGGAGG